MSYVLGCHLVSLPVPAVVGQLVNYPLFSPYLPNCSLLCIGACHLYMFPPGVICFSAPPDLFNNVLLYWCHCPFQLWLVSNLFPLICSLYCVATWCPFLFKLVFWSGDTIPYSIMMSAISCYISVWVKG